MRLGQFRVDDELARELLRQALCLPADCRIQSFGYLPRIGDPGQSELRVFVESPAFDELAWGQPVPEIRPRLRRVGPGAGQPQFAHWQQGFGDAARLIEAGTIGAALPPKAPAGLTQEPGREDGKENPQTENAEDAG